MKKISKTALRTGKKAFFIEKKPFSEQKNQKTPFETPNFGEVEDFLINDKNSVEMDDFQGKR